MRNKTQAGKIATLAAAALAFAGLAKTSLAQGCVAAHSPQPAVAGLTATEQPSSTSCLHGLTLTTGFRTYSSFHHYVGTVYQAQRAILGNQVENHVDLYDLDPRRGVPNRSHTPPT